MKTEDKILLAKIGKVCLIIIAILAVMRFSIGGGPSWPVGEPREAYMDDEELENYHAQPKLPMWQSVLIYVGMITGVLIWIVAYLLLKQYLGEYIGGYKDDFA